MGHTGRFLHIRGIRLLGHAHEEIDRVSPIAIYFDCADDQVFMVWIQFPMEGLHLSLDRSAIEDFLTNNPAYGRNLQLIGEWKLERYSSMPGPLEGLGIG